MTQNLAKEVKYICETCTNPGYRWKLGCFLIRSKKVQVLFFHFYTDHWKCDETCAITVWKKLIVKKEEKILTVKTVQNETAGIVTFVVMCSFPLPTRQSYQWLPTSRQNSRKELSWERFSSERVKISGIQKEWAKNYDITGAGISKKLLKNAHDREKRLSSSMLLE